MATNQSAGSSQATRIDRKRIALLHVAKARLGMSDEDYRAMLDSVGATSSVELTLGKFSMVMDRMKAGGFVGNPTQKTPLKGGRARAGTTIPSVEDQKRKLTRKIASVLEELGKEWRYADGMARKMFGVQLAEWLEAGQLYKLLQALMVYQKRKSGDPETA